MLEYCDLNWQVVFNFQHYYAGSIISWTTLTVVDEQD